MILRTASSKNKKVNMLSMTNRIRLRELLGSFRGLSIAIVIELAIIRTSTPYSKHWFTTFYFLYFLNSSSFAFLSYRLARFY